MSTFNRDNVSLVTEPIEKITGSGVATTDGESVDVDVLILATGFRVMDSDGALTYPVTGPDGRTLTQFWEDHRLQAYEGVSIPGFPNFCTVFGPVRLRRVVVFRAHRVAEPPHRPLPHTPSAAARPGSR